MKYYFLALATMVVVCVGCAMHGDGQQIVNNRQQYHAPPAAMLERPGPMVDGPGPGVMQMMSAAPPRSFASATTQVRFIGPRGMSVGWQIPDGYAENQVIVPGRYNFGQGAVYRLKLSNVPGREGMVLYPTLQVYPAHPTTDAYLSHNSVPIELTDEDLDQVQSNNFVTKVIYLPDPRYQELAIAGVETLVSTRLDPGVDPVAEADRRGTIMAVLRMGNMDLETGPGGPMPPGNGHGALGHGGGVRLVGYDESDGGTAGFAPPMPIGGIDATGSAVPHAMIVAGHGIPGQPVVNPISGVNMPVWGMTTSGTPIGLPGPPHMPLGRPAGLKSHTVVNRSKNQLPKPTEHMLMTVRHNPGYSLPKPVSHIEYTETHPVYTPGEVSYPAYSLPQPNGGLPPAGPTYGGGAYGTHQGYGH